MELAAEAMARPVRLGPKFTPFGRRHQHLNGGVCGELPECLDNTLRPFTEYLPGCFAACNQLACSLFRFAHTPHLPTRLDLRQSPYSLLAGRVCFMLHGAICTALLLALPVARWLWPRP
jgi:hypothetical protein